MTSTRPAPPRAIAPHERPQRRMSRPELRGRASGVAVLGFFALAWSGWAVSTVSATWRWAVQVPAGIATLLLFVLVGLLCRRAPSAPSDQPGQPAPSDRPGQHEGGPSVGRRFGLIVVAEFAGLFGLAGILGASGHAEVIAAVVCAGVGVHFFPLARLFHLRLYDLTGTALCVVAVAAAAAAVSTGTPALWTTVSGAGAAAVLYATSGALAAQTFRRS